MLKKLSAEEIKELRSKLAPVLAEGNNSELRIFANSNRHLLKTEAAVLLLLCHTESNPELLSVILTKRSSTVSTYKGEVSLPGGKCESNDCSPADTAVREAKEEIGVPLGFVTPLAQLSPVVSRFRQLVVPVIAALNQDFLPSANGEVEVIFSLPVSRFLSTDNHTVQQLLLPGFGRFDLHCFNDHLTDSNQLMTTYGLTAHLCIILACLLHFPKLPQYPLETKRSRTPFELYEAYQRHNLAYLKHLIAEENNKPLAKL